MPTFNPILGRPSRGVKKDDALLKSVNRRTQGMTEKIEALMGRFDDLKADVDHALDKVDTLVTRLETLEKKVNKPKKGDIKGRLDALEADR